MRDDCCPDWGETSIINRRSPYLMKRSKFVQEVIFETSGSNLDWVERCVFNVKCLIFGGNVKPKENRKHCGAQGFWSGYPLLRTILVLVFGPGLSSMSFAQEPVFRHYTLADGLPSSETYSVVQDRNGYIWVSSDRGLARFNGYEFKVFTSVQGGLLDNTIFGLYKDHRQWVWYFGYNGSVGYLKGDSFCAFEHNDKVRAIFKSKRLEGLSIDQNGGFMSVYQRASCNVPVWINSKGQSRQLPLIPGCRDIYFSRNNTSVVAGEKNAKTTRLISQETLEVIGSFPSLAYDNANMSSFVCRKRNGDLLFYCAYEIFLLNNKGIKRVVKCKERVLNMVLDSKENLWVGYMNKGLEMYPCSDSSYQPSVFKQLSKNSVSGITQDKEGGLWFTTLEDGVFYLPPDFILSFGKESGLPLPKARIIENLDDKLVFVMSDHSLVYKYHNQSTIHAPAGKSWKGYNDIVHTAPGVTYYAKIHNNRNHLTAHWRLLPVQKIDVGRFDIWGYISSELHRCGEGSDTTIFFDQIGKITSVKEIGKEEVLVATLNGLYLYKYGTITSLKSVHPLFSQRISNMVDLGKDHLVFATIGSGLLIVNKKGFRESVHYTCDNGLPSNMCHVLIAEDDSTLIAGTNNGVCRITKAVDRQSSKIYTVSVNNGLNSNEVHDLEIVGDDLWVAAVNGLSILPLKLFADKKIPVFLNMEEVRVNNQKVNKRLEGHFSYEENSLHFTFSGINFQYNNQLLYHYRLKGSDDGWHCSSNRTVIYNALAPGNYVFEVYVRSADGKINSEKISYAFSVLPPFWRTWWFIACVSLVLCYWVYCLVARRIQKIREQVKVQNELNNFKDKALRSQMNPHFIYNSMNAIQNYIQKNETEASIDYLNLFSRLMRNIFNYSEEKTISLEKDLEAVLMYVEMENMRFSNRFKLHLLLDDELNIAQVQIPPFLIQPFVENSILHGFRSREGIGNLWVSVKKLSDRIKISIKDDGIGRSSAMETSRRKQAYRVNDDRRSSGTKVTLNRIREFWGKSFSDDLFRITDLYSDEQVAIGTLIEFYLPIIKDDKSHNSR